MSAARVSDFLAKAGLASFAPAFFENGFDDMELLGAMETSHLQACGLKSGHVLRFQRAVSATSASEFKATPTKQADVVESLDKNAKSIEKASSGSHALQEGRIEEVQVSQNDSKKTVGSRCSLSSVPLQETQSADEQHGQLKRSAKRQKSKAQVVQPVQNQKADESGKCPPRCKLCDLQLSSLPSAVEHLAGYRHIVNLLGKLQIGPSQSELHGDTANSSAAGFSKSRKYKRNDLLVHFDSQRETSKQELHPVLVLLQHAQSRAAHVELGFDVDALEAAVRGTQLHAEVLRVAPSFEWLQVEGRWWCSWNSKPSGTTLALREAPAFQDICSRCSIDERPPVLRMPASFPAQIPKLAARRAHLRWPDEPTSRLGAAVMMAKQIPFDQVHLIASTSFMHALAGEARNSKDKFYLQQCGPTVMCLHVPVSKSYDRGSTGHAVEVLVRGCGRDSQKDFYSSSLLRIGKYRVLVTSEIDVRNGDGADQIVEVKSSKKGLAKMLSGRAPLQLACNGSDQMLCCHVNQQETHVTKIESLSREEVLEKQRRSFTYAGQRVSLLLDKILSDELLSPGSAGAAGSCLRLSFNNSGVPTLELATERVQVVPHGMDLGGEPQGEEVMSQWSGWKRVIDDELNAAGGELPWKRLRTALVSCYKRSHQGAMILYLPKTLNGIVVLAKADDGQWLADNSHLQASTPGLGYRFSKSLDDKSDDMSLAWGSKVQGLDEGDWVRVEVKCSDDDEIGLQALASIPDGYLNTVDNFVRLPR